jgi:hypothetical protein
MCVSIATSIPPYFVSVAANQSIASNTLKYFYDKMPVLKSELSFIFRSHLSCLKGMWRLKIVHSRHFSCTYGCETLSVQ